MISAQANALFPAKKSPGQRRGYLRAQKNRSIAARVHLRVNTLPLDTRYTLLRLSPPYRFHKPLPLPSQLLEQREPLGVIHHRLT